MLRNLLIAISLILFSSTSFAKTNLPVLICNSFAEVEGWDGSETEAILSYTAYIKSSTKLVDAVVTGPYFSDKSDVKVNKTTKNYVQFQSLEDAWFWFDLSIPKGFDKIEHSFIGNVDVHGEEMFGSKTVEMKCFIKRPLKPKASSSETMTEIAEQIGEYFSADEVNSLGYQASLVKENNAPKKLLSKIKNLLEINNEQLAPQAEVYEINGYVVKDQQGEVIGYIITTDEHYPSNSLHDGSGITYYLDTDYKIVEKISWAG